MKITLKKYIFILSIVALGVSYTFLNNQPNKNIPLIPKSVLFGNPTKARPSLSPQGTLLAYFAPYNGVLNIWVKTIGKDDDKAITKDTKRTIYDFNWTSDGKKLLYTRDNDGSENSQVCAVDCLTDEVKNYTLFPGVKAHILEIGKDIADEILIEMNKENPKFFDAYTLNLETGMLTLVAKNPGTFTQWIVTKKLQVLGALQTNSDGSQDLFVRNNHDEQWRKLLSVDFEDSLVDELYSGVLGFNNDTTLLYLNTSLGTNTRSLQSINIQTGERIVLFQDPDFDLTKIDFNIQTDEPEILYWDKGRLYCKILNPQLQDAFNYLRSMTTGDVHSIGQSHDGTKRLIAFGYDTKSFEYYLYDFTTEKLSFLFHYLPEINQYTLAPIEPISYRARDGLKIHGYLTCPSNVERKNLPLVVYVHGGPFARDSWGWQPVVQLLANRGCACLQINFRGSTGYGKSFLAAGNGQWGGTMHDDLIDGVNWAIKQGIADPKKIAIFGCSYGGYAALVGATFTPDIFCCAIDYCGPSNLITVLQTLPPYWSLAQWEKRIGKLSDEEFLKSRSPLFKIDAIKIPLLIAHGANDVRVKQSESEQIVEAMKTKGLPYEYYLFPDEGHGLRQPENRLKLYGAIEKFLAQHLGCRYED